jgi:hypothetical protein
MEYNAYDSTIYPKFREPACKGLHESHRRSVISTHFIWNIIIVTWQLKAGTD